jgi:hypothetical protein
MEEEADHSAHGAVIRFLLHFQPLTPGGKRIHGRRVAVISRPRYVRGSTSATLRPALAIVTAAAMPARDPPTTTTSRACSIGNSLRPSVTFDKPISGTGYPGASILPQSLPLVDKDVDVLPREWRVDGDVIHWRQNKALGSQCPNRVPNRRTDLVLGPHLDGHRT